MKTAGQKEGAGLLERATPGPYRIGERSRSGHQPIIDADGYEVAEVNRLVSEADANAELFALAYDHALLLRALTAGWAKWMPTASRVALYEAPDSHVVERAFTTTLDAAGCPALTEELRAVLRKVVGSNG